MSFSPSLSYFPCWKKTLLNKITDIGSNILNQAYTTVTKTLLFGNWKYSNEVNVQIFSATIIFILKELMNFQIINLHTINSK